MQLSVVATLYRSEPFVAEFCRRMCAAAETQFTEFELILVNDGSPDNALERAVEAHRADPRVVVVDLSRNFGHHKAIMTGLAYTRGDLVFLIDSDLEEEPEWLADFAERLRRDDLDAAYGVQRQRKGGVVERWGGALFYRLFNALSSHPVPPNQVTTRLMTRHYVTALLRHTERELCLMGVFALTGFRQGAVPVVKLGKGSTTYTFRKRVAMMVDAVTSFSNKPLLFIFNLGVAILVLAGIAALQLIIRQVFFGALMEGWPSLIVSIWLLGGLNVFCIGIVGIYLAKVFSEAKQRPYAIVHRLYGRESELGESETPVGAAVSHPARPGCGA